MTKHAVTPVLLCGGSGTRLWPLSRADCPKQLQALAEDETMLQVTARRASGETAALRFAAPVVVAGEQHRFQVAEQLLHIGVQPQAVILEPEGRNTAPAVALAAHLLVASGNGDGLMLVMPSDHMIADPAAFQAVMAQAAPAAAAGRLVTFGIRPTEPATGYGYIEPAEADGDVRAVRRFVEKPDAETAARYIASGYLWNAGIFLVSPAAYLAALELHAPEVARTSRAAAAGASRDGLFERPEAAAFASSPSISLDYAVMERAANVSVAPVDMGWSDVGSWDALWRVTPGDADGNVVRGSGAMIDCTGSLLRNAGGPFVAGLGLHDMVVVATADAVLVAPRSRAEDIRKVVDRLERDGLALARTSHEVKRPWGSYRGLGQGDGWQVKQIVVKPGGLLSLQKHARRAETWVVTAGEALVTVDDTKSLLGPGETVSIPLGAVHRLENPGPVPLELIEVQRGNYLGEDDIVRL
ncbi:MAG: mannose-1-phosphate guanylyltransferase/mannose-6-phosphate isomerase, partial [Sandaracinobacteroides sp.]